MSTNSDIASLAWEFGDQFCFLFLAHETRSTCWILGYPKNNTLW